jgi:[ribosomal protein S18]-alanine N-acetyltransferase
VTVRLRPMRSNDVDALVTLAQVLFTGDPPWSAAHFESELAGVPETRWYVIAEVHGDVAGYAGLVSAADTADVQTLAVAPAYQRRGIGTTLLAAVIDEATRRRVGALLLEVRADNDPALALYRRHGFEQVSRRRGYYDGGKVDALVLRRVLPADDA